MALFAAQRPAGQRRNKVSAKSERAGASHHLIVVSDVICPWCFMAKRNLEKALQMLGPKLQVEITWSAFELNPEMPKEGIDRHQYRTKKFGSWIIRSLSCSRSLSRRVGRNNFSS